MTNFVRFEEYNEWEGESWVWWLQLDGNEGELEKFEALLVEAEAPSDDALDWTLDLETVEDEYVVDKLVQHAHSSSYYDDHNKVTGRFTCPDEYRQKDLYKGGIRDLFS